MFDSNIKPSEIEREWYLIDAEGKVLGRMASRIADVLRGKNRSYFSPQWDMGDYVIVINANKVVLTGGKDKKKIYYHHTGYPGGLKEKTAEKLREENPEKMIRLAVKRMLPQNKLSRAIIKKLYVYPGSEHPHQGQKPKKLVVGSQ